MIVGRARERAQLQDMFDSPKAELLALYGRRRVGKTFLIREFFSGARSFLTVTGEKDASAAVQRHHFTRELSRTFYAGRPLPTPPSWRAAFDQLAAAVEDQVRREPDEPIVLFFDELPWLSTPRSGLLQALDHSWNTRLSRVRQLRFIVCGSAASWMLDKLVHAKGGLHNRITRRIRLEPFTLPETRAFLASKRLRASPRQVIETYLAVGGVPHYLEQMRRGRSAAQNIGHVCFDADGLLVDEFGRLFASLFRDGGLHESLVRVIARKRHGVTRNELIDASKIASGGSLNRPLRELEEAGFIGRLPPYGAKKKNTIYRLLDEYSWFYLKWIESAPRGVFARQGQSYWTNLAQTPSYRSWAGYAFEGLCLKHTAAIRRALGIESVAAKMGSWRYAPKGRSAERRGAQVDLVIDREDGVINLCELKYGQAPFVITKRYARDLKEKIAIFEAQTRTSKEIHLTLVSPEGLKANTWSEDLVTNVVDQKALFDEE